jgi:hypothetical protein
LLLKFQYEGKDEGKDEAIFKYDSHAKILDKVGNKGLRGYISITQIQKILLVNFILLTNSPKKLTLKIKATSNNLTFKS